MSTNYYRIPTDAEMQLRKEKLIQSVKNLDISADSVERRFGNQKPDSLERITAWDEFTEGTRIHLGTRSAGWKFLWNFNDKKYYSNREQLLQFIREGRVVNEFGEELKPEEFIEMALNWNGLDVEEYYKQNPTRRAYSFGSIEKTIDGLRVSNSVNFS